MKSITVRLTDDEHKAIEGYAKLREVPIGTIVRMASMALAQKQGAPKRSAEGTAIITVEAWPKDTAAVELYKAEHQFATTSEAFRSAARVGLIYRGHLDLDGGLPPDAMPVHK